LVAQSLDCNFLLLPAYEIHCYTCANKHSAFCCVNDQIYFLPWYGMWHLNLRMQFIWVRTCTGLVFKSINLPYIHIPSQG
jgi:hypothetical protein